MFRNGMVLLITSLCAAAQAAPPDFSICDGLSGAAWGLCRGGVAAGCADGSGSTSACMVIEENFRDVTGRDAPWITPPPACPCDYVADVPMTAATWSYTPSDFTVVFSCPGDTASFKLVPEDGSTQLPEVNAIRIGGTSTGAPICQAATLSGGNVRDISEDELPVCRDDVIDYANAFMTLNPTHPVTDNCSGTLP